MGNEVVILSETLGFEVDHVTLSVANHLIYGFSTTDIAEVLAVPEAEILSLVEEDNFKMLRAHLSLEHADKLISTESSWDNIEHKSLQNLAIVLEDNKDPELNLKAAAIANKAQRRTIKGQRAQIGQAGTVVQLNLTQNFIKSVQNANTIDGVPLSRSVPGQQGGAIAVDSDGNGRQSVPSRSESNESQSALEAMVGVEIPPEEPKVLTSAGNATQLVKPSLEQLNHFLDPQQNESATDTLISVQQPTFTLDQ